MSSKRYLVDVSNLTAKEKMSVREQVNRFSFMVNDAIGNDGKVWAYVVYWDMPGDFMSSSSRPSNCPCKEF